MEKLFNKIFKITIFSLASMIFLISCNFSNEADNLVGTVQISFSNVQSRSINSRSIISSDYDKVKVHVISKNQTNSIVQTFSLNQATSTVSLNNIPIGINKIIIVEALDANDAPIEGLKLYKLADIYPGTNSITINWDTTPLGKVFYQLYSSDLNNNTSYSMMDSSIVETKIQEIISSNSLIHPSFVDCNLLAFDIINLNGQIPQSNNYVIAPCHIEFNLINKPNENLYIRVSDPSTNQQLITQDGNYSFSFIPGTWDVQIIRNNNDIIYQSQINAQTAGSTCTNVTDIQGNLVPLSSPIDLSQLINSASSQILCTSKSYSETDNIEEIVHQELGSNFRVADWQDFSQYVGSLDALFDSLSISDGESVLVTYNGNHFVSGSTRHYILTRGIPHSGALVHAQYGNEAWLGSWYGLSNLGIVGYNLSYNNNQNPTNYSDTYGFENSFDQPSVISSGNMPWLVSTLKYNSGTSSYTNGNIGDNQNSIFTITDTVATGYKLSKVSFYYSTATELNFDFLKFKINGINKLNISGTNDWTFVEYTNLNITEGNTYTLQWEYVKDCSVSTSLDAVWVDDITIEFEKL